MIPDAAPFAVLPHPASQPAPLTGGQKRALKSRAQLLDAVVRVGHAGVTDAVVASLEEALLQHGLVKVRFSEFKEQRRELSQQLAERTGSFLIQQVGHTVVFFREQPPLN
ncbi:MAG: YhbY family RNA-binding protein [Verrucomicrobia bacterium]|nr:YhbY family RNA-binding protein [Verrucomicrobiota bacterium]